MQPPRWESSGSSRVRKCPSASRSAAAYNGFGLLWQDVMHVQSEASCSPSQNVFHLGRIIWICSTTVLAACTSVSHWLCCEAQSICGAGGGAMGWASVLPCLLLCSKSLTCTVTS